MKKRVFAALLALAAVLALLPAPVFALDEGFSDISDAATLRSVEVLRLMGVVSGDGGSTFRPYSRLTRAEFCKMTIELQGKGEQAVRYRSRTIFPDVRAAHWAAGYINLSTTAQGEKEPALMHGFPDGTFLPNQNISYGEAVTVLMRVLGYSDADSGGVWPQGYLDLAAAKKLTAGLSLSGDAAITRAQAAKLFVNALSAEKSGGGTLYKLGEAETTLMSVDLAKGVMRTADGSNPVMVKPLSTMVLRGMRGRVVLDANGKALTFLPSSDTTGSAGGTIAGGAASDEAVIVAASGSTAGFDALTGGRANYTIYRNGMRVNSRSLKKYDVATYSAENNAILVCDTRVSAYYESCMPSPSEPITVEALAGTKFNVLSTARQGVSEFRPGDLFVLLLTADGQVAGAVKPGTPGAGSNATGYVDSKGKVQMFCGASMIDINAAGEGKTSQVVGIGQTKAGSVILTQAANQVAGALDLSTGMVGTVKLADNVLALQDGVLTSLSSLGISRIEANRIVYVRRNDAGEADLIVLGVQKSNMLYGRATLTVSSQEWVYYDGKGTKAEHVEGKNGYTASVWLWYAGYGDEAARVEGTSGKTTNSGWEWFDGFGPKAPHQENVNGYTVNQGWVWNPGYGDDVPHTGENGYYVNGFTISVDDGSGTAKGPYIFPQNFARDLYTGDFVSVRTSESDEKFAYTVAKMKKSTAVSKSSWVGTTVATADGVTYSIASDTPCWNADSKTWFKDLETALDYGGIVYFYIADDAVRVIEVHG